MLRLVLETAPCKSHLMKPPKKALPNVLGEKLALGLARTAIRQLYDDQPKELTFEQFKRKRSLSARFNVFVNHHLAQCGEGLVSISKKNSGKREEVETISAFFSGAKPVILFNQQILQAIGMVSPEKKITKSAKILPTIIQEHAVQRCIQSLHSTSLSLIAKEFYSHYKQASGHSSSDQKVYSMTESGMCIWLVRNKSEISEALLNIDYLDDKKKQINYGGYLNDGEYFYICKTYIGGDVLDRENAIRRQRWREGLSFQ